MWLPRSKPSRRLLLSHLNPGPRNVGGVHSRCLAVIAVLLWLLQSTWCTSFFTARQAGSSSAVRSHSSTCAAKSDGRALNPPFDSSERSANQSRQAGSRCREGSSSGVATATLMSRSATLPQPNRTHFGRHALTALPVLHPASVRPCPARTWLARLAASTWSLSLVTCTSSKWVLSLLSAPYKHGTH